MPFVFARYGRLGADTNCNPQGVAVSPVDGSTYLTASSETASDVLVARVRDTALFVDDFESGNTSRWAFGKSGS